MSSIGIEEVKKILRTLLKESGLEIRTDSWTDAHYQLDYFGGEIYQLFTQPLDKELEKEIIGSIDKVIISYETMLACQVAEKFIESRELVKQRGAKLILALLPDIEEARKAGFDDGVSKTTIAMDSTIDAQLGEARKQERD